MKLILGITGAIAVAGAAAGALVATPASTAVRSGNGLVAWVGYGQNSCTDDVATQQQGGTGKLQNKACFSASNVQLFPSIASVAWVGNAAGSLNNSVAAGNVIGSSPMGIGNTQNDGIGS